MTLAGAFGWDAPHEAECRCPACLMAATEPPSDVSALRSCAPSPAVSAETITLDCPSGHDDCTTDCGRCKGQGVIKVGITDRTVARSVAADFRSYERHEMPYWSDPSEERDRELVMWTMRCLANPGNGWPAGEKQ